ncbi:nucleoside kinase [Synechococcus sp. HB1133]|uniref:uridine kinase family protein n=1 Tax=Synechococcus sp. HBA1120 TaxID=2508341 RepID=UPI00140C8B34|nr:nucleoside kinase [Synechococcus sp. HBA1120]MCB4395200.1 nucleoside kinase [Synechococcus sp. PH41509]MCB4422364.1 nucleoside kinase [Synechococcus sp. HB1133]MCB4429531.1 nucleoside kinase [Synechococcus sp. HBA1120]NHI81308.1 nucleoside kinase [Synechococcus sp. HB1133]
MSGAVPLFCICGPSAAGKTTFAAHLAEQLRARGRHPLLIACDDYYRSGWSPVSRYGFDTVDAIDADQLRLQVSAVRYRQLDSLRSYDMRARKVGSRPLNQPYDLILVEGSYGPQLLLEAVPISLVVYIEAPVVQRLIRRLWRDVRDRHRPALYVIRQMLREMLPGERRFIYPLKRRADVIIQGMNKGLENVLERID